MPAGGARAAELGEQAKADRREGEEEEEEEQEQQEEEEWYADFETLRPLLAAARAAGAAHGASVLVVGAGRSALHERIYDRCACGAVWRWEGFEQQRRRNFSALIMPSPTNTHANAKKKRRARRDRRRAARRRRALAGALPRGAATPQRAPGAAAARVRRRALPRLCARRV